MDEAGTVGLQNKVLNKTRHFFKPFVRFHHRTWYIVRQYYIVSLTLTACFLPVRLIWWTYVAKDFGTNAGIMTIIAIVIWILVSRNKLGWWGEMFKNRIRRLVLKKLFYVAIIGLIIDMLFTGGVLVMMDRGMTVHEESRKDIATLLIYSMAGGNVTMNKPVLEELYGAPSGDFPIINGTFYEILKKSDSYPSDEQMMKFGYMNNTERKIWANEFLVKEHGFWLLEVVLSSTLHIINVESGYWASHFGTVFFIGQVEGIGLLIFYRKIYFKKVGVTWTELGEDKRHLRKFIHQNRNHQSKINFKQWVRNFA